MIGNKSTLRHGCGRRGQATPEYKVWREMTQRCTNRNHKNWEHYGGRGVSVCDRWRVFENFLADVGNRPSAHHTLDRYPDNSGNYEPGNVRWATRKDQTRNRRETRTVTMDGQTRPLAEWCEILDVPYKRVESRLRLGWTAEAALKEPKSTRVHRLNWRCRRCEATTEMMSRHRTKCLQCGAGRSWLEKVVALGPK